MPHTASAAMELADTTSETYQQIVIRPNHSMSWQGNSTVFLSFLFLSIPIAGFFVWKGFWVIAPFSGLELIFIGVVLYTVWHKTQFKETMTITDNEIIIHRGIDKPKYVYSFPRNWVQVILSPASRRGYPSKLWLRSHGRQVEIASCLNDIEKRHLADKIRQYSTSH